MPSKTLSACVDANVFFSAIAFGGKPEEILQALLERHFVHATSHAILEETRRNLFAKVKKVDPLDVEKILDEILKASNLIEPQGTLKAAKHAPDNLILETALMGGCDVLVTGDKEHLLPMNPYQGLIIEPPSAFLERLSQSQP